MRFGSVCSGIEAASVAFEPLGWKAAWFSEIEPFPMAVLKHHYPQVPNLGDMTTLPNRIKSGEVEAPDLFCGGTPCQAFSVAGLRQSLADDRGNLSLTFCEIANAIDDVRLSRGDEPAIIFWENVPGVLSTQDNAFGCFLAALSGCDTPIAPSRLGWTDAGVVAGPGRTVAWRILDAQYFGLAQRRRRVFVVASARKGFDPAAVLLEWEGLRRDSAPRRETRQRFAADTTSGAQAGSLCARSGRSMSVQDASQGHLIPTVANCHTMPDKANFQAVMQPIGVPDVMATLLSSTAGISRPGNAVTEHETYIPMAAQPIGFTRCDYGNDAVIDGTPTMRCGSNYSAHLAVAQPIGFNARQDPVSSPDQVGALDTNSHTQAVAHPMVLMDQGGSIMNVVTDGTIGTLRRETKGHEPIVMQPIAIQGNLIGRDGGGPHGIGASDKGLMYTLTGMDVHGVAQPIPIDSMNHLGRGDSHSFGDFQPGAPSYTLTKNHHHAVAQPIALQDVRGIEKAQNGRGWNEDGTAYTVDTHATQEVAVPIAWDEELNASVDQAGTLLRGGDGGRHDGVLAPTLTASNNPSRSPQSSEITAQVAAVAQATAAVAMRESGQGYWMQDDIAGTIDANMGMSGHANRPAVIKQPAMQVRRLTPVECERLQGFPDGYTAIPWRGKPASECPDGPRYKALGNSWAVPCVQWIGRRIHKEALG